MPRAIRPPKQPITGETPASEPTGTGPKSTGMGLIVPRLRRRDQRERARNAPVALALTLRSPGTGIRRSDFFQFQVVVDVGDLRSLADPCDDVFCVALPAR